MQINKKDFKHEAYFPDLFYICMIIDNNRHMKKAISTIMMTVAMTFVSLSSKAQEAFKGVYRCDTLAATLTIDLTAPTISLPDLDFDETYGYMKGQLNGTWVILKVKKTDKKKALVRMISDIENINANLPGLDIGIDAQDVELSLTDEGNLQLRLVGEQNMKAISQRKYVKMPKVASFIKK